MQSDIYPHSELPAHHAVIVASELLAQLDTAKSQYDILLKQMIAMKRHRFGERSEKLRPAVNGNQTSLFDFDDTPSVPAPEKEIVIEEHKRVVKRGRKPLPENLRRNRIEYKPEETHCPSCHTELALFDGEVTEELEYIPAELVVNEHVRLKGVCPCGCKFGVETGSVPEEVQPLARRRPGAGLLAHIIISKFVDHLPLYRQEQMFLRQNVELRRQRLCDWMHGTAEEIIKPLYTALQAETKSSRYCQGDETEIRVQDGEVEGKCHRGYFWAVHAVVEKLAYFEYRDNRSGESAREIFTGFQGTLQTDLYAGYNSVLLPDDVQRIACLAHVRRKFVEVQSFAQKDCTAILELIGKLYAYERKWGKDPPVEERKRLREQFSLPVLEQLRTYSEALSKRVLPRSPVMQSITYMLSQWEHIERIFTSGVYELDNNSIERQIRPIAIGRKNYLFAGSHDGAQNAAMFYSLIATCKLNKVNVFDWMRDIITRVPGYPITRIGELLPHRWKPIQKTPDLQLAA